MTLTRVKLNVRPAVSTEPTHFLTLMSNGKAFSSLDDMAYSYQCSDQFQFLSRTLKSQGVGFFETLKNTANLFKNNLNNMKSQIQKTKEWWNCGINNTNIFPKKASHEGTKTFRAKTL